MRGKEQPGKMIFRKIWSAAAVLLCCVFLWGCTARELEEREFVQAMEVELSGKELLGGFGGELVRGENVEELKKETQMKMDKYLDLGHVKVIVMGKKLLADRKRTESVIQELMQMPAVSGNCMVLAHTYKEEESYLKKLEEAGKNPGEYLSDLEKNNPYKKSSSVKKLAELLEN